MQSPKASTARVSVLQLMVDLRYLTSLHGFGGSSAAAFSPAGPSQTLLLSLGTSAAERP